MSAIYTHLLILIGWVFLGLLVYFYETASGLSGGLLGKHFASTMYFLGLAIYAVAASIVTIIVALAVHHQQRRFSGKGVIACHLLTVFIGVGSFFVYSIWENVEYRNFAKGLEFKKAFLKDNCPDLVNWQWIKVAEDRALTVFYLRASADVSIAIDDFAGYREHQYFHLHPKFQKKEINFTNGETTSLAGVVLLQDSTNILIEDFISLRFKCNNAYIAFNSKIDQPFAEFSYFKTQPIYNRVIGVPEEPPVSDRHRQTAAALLRENVTNTVNK